MKILIIGNSFIGALKSAIPETDNIFTFVGASTLHIKSMKCTTCGNLQDVKYSPKGIDNLYAYTHIVIYADLINPILVQYNLQEGLYSNAVVEQTWRDSVINNNSYELAKDIKNNTGIESFIIPQNYRHDWEGYITSADDCFATANRYSEFKIISAGKGIYNKNGKPDFVFYKDSVYIEGIKSNKPIHPYHDNFHQNTLAGQSIYNNLKSFFSIPDMIVNDVV